MKKQLTLLFTLLISTFTFAQIDTDDLVVTVDATGGFRVSGAPGAGVTISVEDPANPGVDLFTYPNVSIAEVIDPADWGGTPTTVKVGYSNNITQFFMTNAANAAKIQTIDQWGTATINSLSFFNAVNMDITATDAPIFAPNANLTILFHTCTSMTDPGNNIGTWDTSNVSVMQGAFNNTDNYNPTNLGNWDVGNVTNFINMFNGNSAFNDASINNWNIGENLAPTATIDMEGMFNNADAFNQPLAGWQTNADSSMELVSNMDSMFRNAALFNQNIGDWNVGRVVSFLAMFFGDAGHFTAFNNGDLETILGINMRDWNIGENLTGTQTIDMSFMFATNRINERNDHFNQDLSNWDVTRVRSFNSMFRYCTVFTGDGEAEITAGAELDTSGLSNWSISGTNTNTVTMDQMFRDARLFNEPLAGWETNAGSTMAYVTNMTSLFLNAFVFNQNLSAWDVGRVTTFSQMFYGANGIMIFNNGDDPGVIGTGLQNWNIGENLADGTPISMLRMFRRTEDFNQDLSGWDVTKVTNFQEMFFDCHLFEGFGTPTWKISGTNTAPITMNNMFGDARVFNQPLATWETAAGSTMAYVTNTSSMFNLALTFNQPLGDWDVGRVTNFGAMFQSAIAFQDLTPSINTWNISENTTATAINMGSMFNNANAFNSPLVSWQTNTDSTMEYVTNMNTMFANADIFNQDLSVWDVGRVTNFNQMFYRSNVVTAYNNGDASGVIGTNLQNWNIGENLTGTQTIAMWRMFRNADQFNQDLTGWDVTKVSRFDEMFFQTNLYEGIGIPTWQISGSNTHAVTMRSMFGGTIAFNQPLSTWETDPGSTMAYVFDIAGMFSSAIVFNQSLGDWDVGRVRDFFVTFTNARAFEDLAPSINNWNISENTGTTAINMERTFENAEVFNSSLAGWETNANSTMVYVNRMDEMFNSADTFNQSLAAWTPIACVNFTNMLNNSALSVANYDATLTSWAQQDLVDNRNLGAVSLEFCAAEPFRASLVADQGWTISGDALGCSPGSVSGAGSLLYWVTAGSHIGADGDGVADWRDISGDGRSFTQPIAANQPSFLNNTTDMVNYNPIMKFDGADDFVAGYDFNLHDLSFPNTPRTNLPIVGRKASSELEVSFVIPPAVIPEVITTATHTAALSALGGDVNTYFPRSWRPATLPVENGNTTEYLELDLGEIVPLSTIRTQGEGSNRRPNNWVTSYTVEVSNNGTNFTQLDGTFTANVNRLDVVLNEFSENTAAQYVRIYPQTWSGYPALRVGVGTKGYTATSTFILAVEDVRQDNVTQSLNHIDANNLMDVSVVDGSGNTTVNNSFDGDNSINLSAAAPALNSEPVLINYTVTGTGEAKLYRDGVEVATDATTPRYLLLGQTHLGGLPTNNYFNGKIAEANLFSIEPNQEERERINTYFAIKYNIPILHNFIYQDENSVVQTIWDTTTNAAYNHNVFALGLDGNQGLNQRISSARDDDSILTAATINDFTALNSDVNRLALTGDSGFVIIGNNDAAETFNPNGAPNKFHVLDRKWFAQVTGDSQNLFIEFNVGNAIFDVDTPPQTTDYFFIKDDNSNGDLSDDTPILMTNTSGDLWSTATAVTVADGQIFTLATSFLTTPAGVSQDLALWLKADAGIDETNGQPIDSWEDQSVSNNNAVQATAANQPTVTQNAINFNTTMTFSSNNTLATSDRLQTINPLTLGANASIYIVNTRPAQTSGGGTSYRSVFASNEDWTAGDITNGYWIGHGDVNLESRIDGPGGVAFINQITGPVATSAGAELRSVINIAAAIESFGNGATEGANTTSGTGGSFLYDIGGNTEAVNFQGPRHFTGDIAEIIVYDDNQSAEKLKIESYLALKYGITLDQTAPVDYVSSGTTPTIIWDSSIDANYKSDIFGIGRDDAGGLNQKVSKSVNSNTVFTVSLDGDDFVKSNNAVVNGHTEDLQFLTFASNGLTTNNQITELDVANYNLGIEREWQVYKTTNFTDAVNLKFEGFRGYDVIQSTDNDFSTDADQTVLGTLDANGELIDATGFVSGSYLTLAINAQAPGDVPLNLALWLKADASTYSDSGTTLALDGVDVEQWDDQSIAGNTVSETTNQPTLRNNTINFNSSVEFIEDNDILRTSTIDILSSKTGLDVYIIAKANENGTLDRLLSQETAGLGNRTFVMAASTVDPDLIRVFGDFGTTGGTVIDAIESVSSTGEYHMYQGRLDDVNDTLRLIVDGEETASVAGALTTQNPRGDVLSIGGMSNGANSLASNIAEVIVYDADNADPINRQKIESYLALKYGITINQTTPVDYISSGTTPTIIWDSSIDTDYASDIFGIGLDNAGSLNQKVSKSINSNTIFTVSLDGDDFVKSNNAVVNEHTNDLQFLTFASNGSTTNNQITELDVANYNLGIEREWQVYKTINFTDAVNLKFEGFRGYDVIQSTDNDFSTDANQTVLGTLDANGELTNVTGLVSGSYLTLAKFQNAPGGVVLSLDLWLKANDGVTETSSQVTEWEDQSDNVDITSQASIAASDDIILNTSALNFNPTVEFTGANNKSLKASLANNNLFNEAVSIYSVVVPQDISLSIAGIVGTNSKGVVIFNGDYAMDAAGSLGARTPALNNVPRLVGGVYTQNNIQNSRTYVDGAFMVQETAARTGVSSSFFEVGGRTQNGSSNTQRIFDGEIAEAIVYNGDQATGSTDRQKIESYLAIKYGITLDASILDYVNTDGVSVYNLANYNNDVFGIANDALQALNQQISKSVNTGAVLTLSSTNNFATANDGSRTILTDKQYLVIGNDGASGSIPASQNTTDLDTDTYFNRVARTWKSVNTGTVGEINLQFDGFDANWVVLTRSTNDDFSATSGTTETQLSASGSVALTLSATSYFTLAQKPIAIEFETATASDVEASGTNLPNLLIDGELIASATIDVLVNAAGTATANTDYVLGNVVGDDAQTITLTIPAGTYSTTNPLPLATLLSGDVPLDVSYASQINPGTFPQETFVPAVTGDYILTHSAAIVTSGTGFVNVGTSLVSNTGSDDILDGLNGDRIDAANLVRTHTISLVAGTTYYLTSGAGGGGNLTDVTILITNPIGLSITDDAIVENNETISLSLSNAQSGLVIQEITGGALIDNHVYTITDDDTPTWEIGTTATIDGDEDGTDVVFTVELTDGAGTTLTNNTGAALTADIAFTGAAAQADFTTTLPTSVSIADGQSNVTINLAVNDDSLVEITEAITATISNASLGSISAADSDSADVADNDADALVWEIGTTATINGSEDGTDVIFTVELTDGAGTTLTNNTGAALTADVAFTGIATPGDFRNTFPTSVSIADGQSNVTITLAVNDDSLVEITEAITATISNVSLGSISATAANSQADVADNDADALVWEIGTTATINGSEDGTDVIFTVELTDGAGTTLTNNTGAALTADVAFTGIATPGDFTNTFPTSVSIADGQSNVTITLAVNDDSLVEITEAITATISNVSLGSISATATNSQADVADNDADALVWEIDTTATIDGDEDGTDVVFTVELTDGAGTTLTNGTGAAITADIAFTGAAAQADFTTTLPTSVSIADGQSNVTIILAVNDDSLVEITEAITATISNASLGSISAADSDSADVADNDVDALVWEIGTTATIDGDEDGTDVVFTVELTDGAGTTLTNGTGAAITADIAFTGAAAQADFTTTLPTSVSIADGQSNVTINLAVNDDSLVEITEAITATISNASLGSISATATNSQADVVDNDADALVWEIGTTATIDGSEDGTDVIFTVELTDGAGTSLTNSTGAAITADVAFTGSAVQDDFITTFPSSVSIADGQNSVIITLAVADDSLVEFTEAITATISNPNLGTISTIAANDSADVADNDAGALMISIEKTTDGIESESPTNAQFTISLDGDVVNSTGAAITGDLILTGTATADSDYTNITTFSILDGENTVVIDIPVLDDKVIEILETVIATISASNVGVVSVNNTATATIEDDDALSDFTTSIALMADGIEAITSENAIFSISLDEGFENGTGIPISGTITYSGTATAGEDFTEVLSFSIEDGDFEALISVPILDDLLIEEDETIIANISELSLGGIGTESATASIFDEDNDDNDNDGLKNGEEGYTEDTDGDGIPNFEDPDDDGDGIPTVEEDENEDGDLFNDDCNENGIPNYLDPGSCGEVGSASTIARGDIATGMSPNGDGNNDAWIIQGIEDFPNSIVSVYNRSGHEVFSANGYQNDWEGNYNNNGKKLPPGSYYYVINPGDGFDTIDGWIFINY